MTTKSPVSGYKLMAFIPTTDREKARAFYRDTLRLRWISEDAYAMAFDVEGIMLRVTNVNTLVPAQYTIAGWQVPDIEEAVKDLSAAGVLFERYPFVPDESGIWSSPNGSKIAWFKDPDGNVLSLAQMPD